VLDALAAERRCGHPHNLVVAATGTGKTWIAAFDYQRLAAEAPGLPLLFVAHRQEILKASLQVFRDVLGQPHFGELLVAGQRPTLGAHVFASIQSLSQIELMALPPERFGMVIVDEFHHAAAQSYTRLLDHLRPRWLLGLTATPERMDGRSVLGWFDQRFAAELRLWDALSAGLLVPFHYFAVADGTDGRAAWRRGQLNLELFEAGLLGAGDAQARRVIDALHRMVDVHQMRALGFCVGRGHAMQMARAFQEAGIPAIAVDGETERGLREAAISRLRSGELRAIFTVDLYNEGVDIPEVDTLLMMRPTESATLFLQQLGRGLRRTPQKAVLTVLDFIGHMHQDFRFEARYEALVGPGRRQIAEQVERGFARLPPGCAIRLEPLARDIVLDHLRASVGRGAWRRLVDELRACPPDAPLSALLARGVPLEEVYGRGWTALRRAAGRWTDPEAPGEEAALKRLGRLLHVDDEERLATWRRWLQAPGPPDADSLPPDERRLLWMWFAALGLGGQPLADLPALLGELWALPAARTELDELLAALAEGAQRGRGRVDPEVPVQVHARYTRDEVVGAWGVVSNGKLRPLREGVLWVEASQTDLLFITLEKGESDYHPRVRYADYPIDSRHFHWETQNQAGPHTAAGKRYIEGQSRVVLFVRARKTEGSRAAPYTCLGAARCVEHRGARPMQIVWALEEPMPDGLLAAGRLTG
jgi:superfamily II DNA or RNA helicase